MYVIKLIDGGLLNDPKKDNWNWKLNFIECPIIKHLILSPDSLWRFCPRPVCEDFVPEMFVKNVDNSYVWNILITFCIRIDTDKM